MNQSSRGLLWLYLLAAFTLSNQALSSDESIPNKLFVEANESFASVKSYKELCEAYLLAEEKIERILKEFAYSNIAVNLSSNQVKIGELTLKEFRNVDQVLLKYFSNAETTFSAHNALLLLCWKRDVGTWEGNRYDESMLVGLIEGYCSINRIPRALEVLELIEFQPYRADAFLAIGKAYEVNGEFENAKSYLLKSYAIEKDEGSAYGLINIAKAFIEFEDYDSAIEIIEKVAENPDQSGIYEEPIKFLEVAKLYSLMDTKDSKILININKGLKSIDGQNFSNSPAYVRENSIIYDYKAFAEFCSSLGLLDQVKFCLDKIVNFEFSTDKKRRQELFEAITQVAKADIKGEIYPYLDGLIEECFVSEKLNLYERLALIYAQSKKQDLAQRIYRKVKMFDGQGDPFYNSSGTKASLLWHFEPIDKYTSYISSAVSFKEKKFREIKSAPISENELIFLITDTMALYDACNTEGTKNSVRSIVYSAKSLALEYKIGWLLGDLLLEEYVRKGQYRNAINEMVRDPFMVGTKIEKVLEVFLESQQEDQNLDFKKQSDKSDFLCEILSIYLKNSKRSIAGREVIYALTISSEKHILLKNKILKTLSNSNNPDLRMFLIPN